MELLEKQTEKSVSISVRKKVRYLLGRRLTQITQMDGVVRKAISEISVHQCQEKKLGVY